MQRIDAGYIYDLGDAVRFLRQFRHRDAVPAYEIWGAVARAQQKVNEFLTQSIFASSLRSVRPSAGRFVGECDAVMKRIVDDSMTTVGMIDLVPLFNAYDQFEPVLGSELSVIVTYLVQAKGAYDVAILVEGGDGMFPENIASKVPEALHDLREGAKSLAFELWTACGFHLHRANEAVLRRYYDHAVGPGQRPHPETMGTLLGELKKRNSGDPHVIVALDSIKNFHRNPIIHPGQNIGSADEALSLVSAIRASMGYMLEELPVILPGIVPLGGTGEETIVANEDELRTSVSDAS